jgi:hypothetical protein
LLHSHILNSQIHKLSNCQIVQLSNCYILQLSNCPIVTLSNCYILTLSNFHIVKFLPHNHLLRAYPFFRNNFYNIHAWSNL